MQDECGETALFAACGMGCYDPAVLLIDHGADVNYLRKVRPSQCHVIMYMAIIECGSLMHIEIVGLI